MLIGTILAFVDNISHAAGNDAQQGDEHEPVVVAEAREIEQSEQGHSRIYKRKAPDFSDASPKSPTCQIKA